MSTLPPHLEIEPVRSLASRPPRRLAFFVACLVYGGAALGAIWWLRMQRKAAPAPTKPSVAVLLVEPEPAPAPSAPKGTGATDPHLAKAVPDPTPELPDDFAVTPSRMPDRPEQAHFDPSLPLAPGGDGRSKGTGGSGGSGSGGAGNGDGPARVGFHDLDILHRVEPEYPFYEMATGVEDTVLLEITIDERGVPISVKVLRSQEPALAKEAVRALKLWRFAAVKKNGVRQKATFEMPVQFMIANRGFQKKK